MLIAVLDADVLFPMILRDTLLRAAAAELCRVHWTHRIQDEVERNLVSNHRMPPDKAQGLRRVMESAFPDALVEGWEGIECDMPNHPKDRHVAAAAVSIGAPVIVTSNIKDFRPLPTGLTAMTPDAFLTRLLDDHGENFIDVLRTQAAGYRQEPKTLATLIDHLAGIAPVFGAKAQAWIQNQ
ncbi:PIN domain-containing protein [Brevundimonas sp.]|uniref:PIN domain-containing protein n=1 Tax=Brevundimonas sp. TaxID=1871086 RepID=UPI002897634E|nr:PIN domain-containing protein [Brevundimonas sp.]